jgi:hypothetical protein
MPPIDMLITGLQALSSWLMSIVAIVALLVSAIICLVVVEVVFARGALVQAYTVKRNPTLQ